MYFASRLRMGGFALSLVLGLGAAGCPPGEKAACDRPSMHTLVFLDQSASSVASAATDRMFRDTVATLAKTGLACRGDAMHAFLVHGNTRGKVERRDAVNDVAPADIHGKAKMAQTQELIRFQADSTAFATRARDGLNAIFSASSDPGLRSHTDVLGTLEVISDELAHADPGAEVLIYYLGDMHESMTGPGRRDFDVRLPRTAPEAEAWADADTAVLATMRIDRARFHNAKVRVVLADLAQKPGTAEVRRYWERLFANAGFRPENIRYN